MFCRELVKLCFPSGNPSYVLRNVAHISKQIQCQQNNKDYDLKSARRSRTTGCVYLTRRFT